MVKTKKAKKKSSSSVKKKPKIKIKNVIKIKKDTIKKLNFNLDQLLQFIAHKSYEHDFYSKTLPENFKWNPNNEKLKGKKSRRKKPRKSMRRKRKKSRRK